MSFGHKRLHVGRRSGLSGDVEVSLSVFGISASPIGFDYENDHENDHDSNLQYRGRGRDRLRNRPDAENLQSMSA